MKTLQEWDCMCLGALGNRVCLEGSVSEAKKLCMAGNEAALPHVSEEQTKEPRVLICILR